MKIALRRTVLNSHLTGSAFLKGFSEFFALNIIQQNWICSIFGLCMFVEFRTCSFDGYVTNSCKGTEKSIGIIVNEIRTDRPLKTPDIYYWNGVELRFGNGCDIFRPCNIACEFDRIIIQQSSPALLMACLI